MGGPVTGMGLGFPITALRLGHREEATMHALPPAVNPLVPAIGSHWLPPIQFGLKSYLELCHSFEQALADLEARFPSHPRILTMEARNKRLKRRPK